MSLKKLPFITSVNLAQIDGRAVVPTIVFYDESKRAHIGAEARELCPNPEQLFEDFKIELGQYDPDAVTKRTINSPHTPRSTTVGIAQDFFRELLGKVNNWLEMQGRPLPKSILIAEPLSLSGSDMAEESWLSNYRRAIRRALHGKFEEIDFMPEPFAVFQYYRYGLRHPRIVEQRKHIALVLDFGGGTFDISVIESTKTGEISQSGTNSRPLSAKSLQIGGFSINRLIVEDLLMEAAEQSLRSDIRKSIEWSNRNRNTDDFAAVSQRQRVFFRHYKRLLQAVEVAKVAVCNSIANWSLEADLSGVSPYPIQVPTNPYDAAPSNATLKIDAGKLRTIFEDKIWKQKLQDAIRKTIDRASTELKGQQISVVLLSGGSSNIRWIAKLLARDLTGELGTASILELNENFQEIVAKGLATECARRFFTEGQGDFRAITYNRLCLALKADGAELEIKRAKPVSQELQLSMGAEIDDGVLLPSASSLRGLVGKPLVWKLRLKSPPKRLLEYFFMRSSFDPDDLDSRHNIVDHRAATPPNTKFQQAIEVELTVRDDGTAIPRFLYGRSDQSPGVAVEGRPFHIDMTFASEEASGSTYLGFDFGTSASACSFVDSKDIQLIEERNRTPEWRELTELLADLPYPVAVPLARFISEVDNHRREERGREAAEALLTLAAYLAYADMCSVKTGKSAFFKNVANRSAGPLWALLRKCLETSPSNLTFAAPLLALTKSGNIAQINTAVDSIAAAKHGKKAVVDYVGLLNLLANHVASVVQQNRFGVFEAVTAKRFQTGKYAGVFRELKGGSQTFVHVLGYEGAHPFSDEVVYVVNTTSGRALPLSPLYYWGLNRSAGVEQPDMFEFDTEKNGVFSYKSTQLSEGLPIPQGGDFSVIHATLTEMRIADIRVESVEDIQLISYEANGS